MTPDFPPWSNQFATHLHRLRRTLGPTLHQFEALFAQWIPGFHLAQQEDGDHSRLRLWSLRLVFWTFLWQVAQAGASCREAIRQAQALAVASGRKLPPDAASPYCQARAKLSLERLEQIHHGLVAEAQTATASKDLWCGHRVRVVDGSTLTLPDTPANQKAYPQQSVQKPGCGFPILRLVGLFCLATGFLSAWATGSWHQHELVLLQLLWPHLRPDDVLLADRGFCCWGLLAQCQRHQIHAVFRVRGTRRTDFRRGRRLSPQERLVIWTKPRLRPKTVDEAEWSVLPAQLTLRVVRCQLRIPGFRTQQILLVTTLLDSAQYPAKALSALYLRRWEMELTLRHLKTTLQMEHLSCLTPENIERELRLHLLVYNLVRRLMLEAARRHGVSLSRVSFAGALAAARRTAEALLQVRHQRQRRQLMEELFRVLAADLVAERPGRREPRALKRRPKPYPLLTCHRHFYREISHRNCYSKNNALSPRHRK
jgi:Transposase DDE domain